MVEFLKHSLGLCGEHWHPNIFTFILGGFGLSIPLSYIKYKLKNYGYKSKSRNSFMSSKR